MLHEKRRNVSADHLRSPRRFLGTELLDVRRNRICFDLVKFEAVLVTPIEELIYRARVSMRVLRLRIF